MLNRELCIIVFFYKRIIKSSRAWKMYIYLDDEDIMVDR